MSKLIIKDWNIENLKTAVYNPRTITEKQREDLKNSLLKYGMVEPIVVNTNPERYGTVIGGHQRLSIWQELGNKTIPCSELNINEKQEKELNIRLNKNTGSFDYDLLQEYFVSEDLVDWGFNDFEVNFTTPEDIENITSNAEYDLGVNSSTENKNLDIKVTFDNEDECKEAKSLIKALERGKHNISYMFLELLRLKQYTENE